MSMNTRFGGNGNVEVRRSFNGQSAIIAYNNQEYEVMPIGIVAPLGGERDTYEDQIRPVLELALAENEGFTPIPDTAENFSLSQAFFFSGLMNAVGAKPYTSLSLMQSDQDGGLIVRGVNVASRTVSNTSYDAATFRGTEPVAVMIMRSL